MVHLPPWVVDNSLQSDFCVFSRAWGRYEYNSPVTPEEEAALLFCGSAGGGGGGANVSSSTGADIRELAGSMVEVDSDNRNTRKSRLHHLMVERCGDRVVFVALKVAV